ncbi:hypothetical protein SynBIOSU31_00891 [Synechococcus sp. BIOS-U3-1]|nr:hypothetical protein SynBIOSU31_00891 [Synechococcus sp. BIOS-U3-1]
MTAPHTKGPVLDASAAWLLKLTPREGIQLHLGTCTQGRCLRQRHDLFFNLQLADTNQSEHETLPLTEPLNVVLR